MHEKENPLLKQIQYKREEMIACARDTGYTSNETILCSQELDKLIYLHQLAAQNSIIEKPKGKIQFRQLFSFLNRFKNAESSFEA